MKTIFTLSIFAICVIFLSCKKEEPCSGYERTQYNTDTTYIVDKDSTSVYYLQNIVRLIHSGKGEYSYPCVGYGKGGFKCSSQSVRFENLLAKKVHLPDILMLVSANANNSMQKFPIMDSLGVANIVVKECYTEYLMWGNPKPTVLYP